MRISKLGHEARLVFISTINEVQNPDLCSYFVLKCLTEVPNHTPKTPLQSQFQRPPHLA